MKFARVEQGAPKGFQGNGAGIGQRFVHPRECLADEEDAALGDDMAIAGEGWAQLHHISAIAQARRDAQAQQGMIIGVDRAAGQDRSRLVAQVDLAEARLQVFAEPVLQAGGRAFVGAAVGRDGADDVAMGARRQPAQRQREQQYSEEPLHSPFHTQSFTTPLAIPVDLKACPLLA